MRSTTRPWTGAASCTCVRSSRCLAFVGRSSAEILSRLSDLPDQVVAGVVNAWREAQAAVADQPDSDITVAGWPLEEVTDPFVLEVHRPVQPEDAPPGLPARPGRSVSANSGSDRVHGAASGGLFSRDGLARVQSSEEA